MSETFRIRGATPGDVPSIAAIYGHEVENGVATFEEIAPSESEMAARLAKIVDAQLPYLVAERQGVVLGYAYAGPYHTRPAYRYTLEDTVYIHREAQRQGVGRALLKELIVQCETVGCRQLIAAISHTPDSASAALHAALGFRMIGITQSVGFKFGRWLDVAYMQRAVGPGDSVSPDRPRLGPSADV